MPSEVCNLGKGRGPVRSKLFDRARAIKSGGSAIGTRQPTGSFFNILKSTIPPFVSLGSKISVKISSFSVQLMFILFKAIFIENISVPVHFISKWTLTSSQHVLLRVLISSKIVAKIIIWPKPVQVSGEHFLLLPVHWWPLGHVIKPVELVALAKLV